MARGTLLTLHPGGEGELGIVDIVPELDAQRRAERGDDEAETKLSLRAWAERVPVDAMRPLSWENFPYMVAEARGPDGAAGLYSADFADAREAVVMKATQVGVSEASWRWIFRQCDVWSDTALYILPTAEHVREFGDERIEPAIASSEYLSARMRAEDVRHKSLKRIRYGWLHLRGSNSKAGAQTVAAQSIVFDEYDDLDQKNVAQIERRITGAAQVGKMPRVRRIGVPRYPGFGIDKEWQSSDQRRWHVECPGCGAEQLITFQVNMRWSMPGVEQVMRWGSDKFEDAKVVERAWRACATCETELTAEAIAAGRWVKGQPESQIPGWHVTRLIVPVTDLVQLVVASRATAEHERETFFQNDLGEAYEPGEAGLTRAAILRACSDELALPGGDEMAQGYNGPNPVTMGLDVASSRPLNYRISEQLPDGRRRALAIGTVDSWRGVERLMRNFNVTMAAIDANPEGRSARAIVAAFPGRAVMVEYDTNYGVPPVVLDPNTMKVRVARTGTLDAMMDSIRQVRNIPLSDPPEGYIDALRAPKRRIEKDSKDRPVARYVSSGPDDYAHAEGYDAVATTIWQATSKTMAQVEADQGAQVADEEVGFQRVRLDTEGDDYDPGFGQGGEY